MEPKPRRTVLRLVLILLLLAAYPAAVVGLRQVRGPAPEPAPVELQLTLTPSPADATRLVVRLAARNAGPAAQQLDQVSLTLIAAERPFVTLLLDEAALEARLGAERLVPPGEGRELGVFEMPRPRGAGAAIAHGRATAAGERRGRGVQVEQPLP